MKQSKTFYLGLTAIIILGILAYFYFIDKCGRDKVICPNGNTTFSHRCPEDLYEEYITDTKTSFDLNFDSIGELIDIKFKDILIEQKRKQISDKYNQYTTRLRQALKSGFYDLNADPCNEVKSNHLALIREKIIANSTQIEELFLQINSGAEKDSAINKVLVEIDSTSKAIEPSSVLKNNTYLVAYYGYNTSSQEFEEINSVLKNRYNLIAAKNLSTKPSWLATKSTIFFYADSSKENATNLAKELLDITGKKFEVIKGNGLGVPGNSMENSLRVHSIN